MEIKDNKTGVPLEHYTARFAEADPMEMSRRSGVPFDRDGFFRLTLMGREVSVSWPGMEAAYEDGTPAAANIRILLGRLLLGGMLISSKGEMKAYNEFPWGNVYLQQFRGRCVMRLAGSYGRNIGKFREACGSLGGVPVTGGDAAYDVPFLPKLTVRLILWEGDDEFPPSAQALFSENFAYAFTAEDMAVVGDVVINAMKGRW